LLKDDEIKALGFTADELKEKKRIFSATGAAMLKWWLPLNWAAHIVQVESTNKERGHLLKEGKVIAAVLINLFNDLEDLADYSQRPMPKIALQAVQFVFWVSLVIGTFSVASYSKTDLIRKFKVLGFKSQGKGKGTFPKKSCLPKMCFSKNWPPCNWLCTQNPAKCQ